MTPPAVANQMGTGLQDFISNPDKLMTVLQDIENVARKSY
jgi:hypothetical protein